MLPEVTVNYGAVVTATVACMVLGYVWYHEAVFGTMWMHLLGKKKDELGKPGPAMVIMLIAAFVLSYVMAHFVRYTGATDVTTGLETGFWIWLGFVATTGVGKIAFSGAPWKLFWIDYGYHLVQFMLIGAILASWK